LTLLAFCDKFTIMKVVKNVIAAAGYKIRRAIKNGQIARPIKCEWCNKKRRTIFAHHEDYFSPLCVEWVCPKCHSEYHLGSNKHHAYPASWCNIDDACLETQVEIDSDRNQTFSQYKHDLTISPTIFGRLHDYT